MPAANTRGPYRRALAIYGLTVLVGTVAWNNLASVWFTGAFATDGQVTWVNLSTYDVARYGMLKGPTGGVPATYSIYGLPSMQIWLLAGLACGALAVLLRLGVFSLIGAAMLWMSRGAATGVSDILSSPAAENRFAIRGTAQANYLDLVWMLMALSLVLAMQITYANNVKRKNDIAAGQIPDPGVLDVFTEIQTSIVGRYARAPKGASGQTETIRTETKTSA